MLFLRESQPAIRYTPRAIAPFQRYCGVPLLSRAISHHCSFKRLTTIGTIGTIVKLIKFLL